MPKSPLHKSLQEFISKVKKTPSSHFGIPSESISNSAKNFIKRCKHPKTHSFAIKNTPQSGSPHTVQSNKEATLDDVDQFLFDNFKSLYINDEDYSDESKDAHKIESPRLIDSPPDLCGSHNFFGSPETSSSHKENVGRKIRPRYDNVGSSSSTTISDTSSGPVSPSSVSGGGISTVKEDSKKVVGLENFITLLTYSPSPYDDLKQSMQEMVEARLRDEGQVDWEFMEELLSCYMNLNDKKNYKYILSAFVDLVVTLRENSGKKPARSMRTIPSRRD